MKKPSTHSNHSKLELEGSRNLIHGALLRQLTRGVKQRRPATFRVFWGEFLDTNTRLRKIRDKSAIAITRADLKRMMQYAFAAGARK